MDTSNAPKISIASKRKYNVCVPEKNGLTVYIMLLSEILEDDGSELNYALQEQVDLILDLGVSHTLFIKTSRDESPATCSGLLMRVK